MDTKRIWSEETSRRYQELQQRKRWFKDWTAGEIEEAKTSFLAWFDDTKSEKETVANADIDFHHRIFTADLYPLLGDPRDKTCLEIGYGSGRLLSCAARVFKTVLGVDIHPPEVRDFVTQLLTRDAGEHVQLLGRDELPLQDDEQIDFAYSFIVIQHFSSFDEVTYYVDCLKQLLKSGGVARLFYRAGDMTSTFDTELQTNNRAETLNISASDFEQLVVSRGFRVVDNKPAGLKKLWDPNRGQSSQHYITFVKP